MSQRLLVKLYNYGFKNFKNNLSGSSPEDVDLYSAMFAEKRVPGAMVGPTLACLLTDQFLRIKKGDRFWYESDQLRGRPIPPGNYDHILVKR